MRKREPITGLMAFAAKFYARQGTWMIRTAMETFEVKLAPTVRRDFLECVEEMRREDEYERRHDQNAGPSV